MKEDKLTIAKQESLLALLCFDQETAGLVSSIVDIELFDSEVYRTIASKAVSFFEAYKDNIGDHLIDELSPILEGEDYRKAELYEEVIRNIHASKDNIKKEYILESLKEWVGAQQFKRALTNAAEEVSRGNIDQGKLIIHRGLDSELQQFNTGTDLTIPEHTIRFLDNYDEYYKIGISGFEEPMIRLGPSPKTLLTFMSPTSKGKSWFLTNCGRFCAQQRLKVLDVTLEMSEDKKVMRYVQNVMAMTKVQAQVSYKRLNVDRKGNFDGFDMMTLKDRPSFTDKNARSLIKNKFTDLRLPIKIKEFPTSGLSVNALEVYLDQMERQSRFIPDVLLIDYADLMQMDSNRVREETGRIYKELRGLAVRREIAVVTATQSNRLGEDALVLTLKHLAEDYTKAATSDMIITYSQTAMEKNHGLARLWIAKNRDNVDNRTFVINQAYQMGQFCLDCYRMPSGYLEEIKEEKY